MVRREAAFAFCGTPVEAREGQVCLNSWEILSVARTGEYWSYDEPAHHKWMHIHEGLISHFKEFSWDCILV